MNARLADWIAPSPVPASTATSQKCHFSVTKYAAVTTRHHWTSVVITTGRGPHVSVGRPQAHAPARADSWTTKNSPSSSANSNPSVWLAKMDEKKTTVVTPSS